MILWQWGRPGPGPTGRVSRWGLPHIQMEGRGQLEVGLVRGHGVPPPTSLRCGFRVRSGRGAGGTRCPPMAPLLPSLTSPLRAGELSAWKACAFTPPAFYRNALFSPHTLHTAPRGRTTHPWGRQWIGASPLHDRSPTGATLNGFQGPHDGGQEGQAKVCVLTVPGGHASSWRQHPELARAPIPAPYQAQSIPPSPESPQIKGRNGESGLCLELGGGSIKMVTHPPPHQNVDPGVSTALGSKARAEARRGVTFRQASIQPCSVDKLLKLPRHQAPCP